MTDLNKERELEAQIEVFKKEAMELWFVPNLADTYKNKDLFSYSIIDGEVFFMREQARQLWSFWNKAKAQAVPVWISADFMKPDEGDLVLGISTTNLAKFNVYQVVALDEFDECEINYWMPLPTAPSESGAEG
jgi:hypothetical protein